MSDSHPRPRGRLPPEVKISGKIDRTKPQKFRFDGRDYQGFAGDTLASALLAAGVRLVGRSFKYHRPRGILSAGSEEPNALVTLRPQDAHLGRREPNCRATVTELYDGLIAESQNRFPSLRLDFLAVNGWLGRFLTAGFYYKTFMWPASFWEKLYEPMIRRAAGLGRAAQVGDPDDYDKTTRHCDILIIGGGAAGLMAARAAAPSGARIMLVDEDFQLGGSLLAASPTIEGLIDGLEAGAWIAKIESELAGFPEVTILRRSTVFGAYDGGTFGVLERGEDHLPTPPPFTPRQRLWRIVAGRAILASGAIERPLLFGNNDRPGVMLAGAMREYLNRFGVAVGAKILVVGNNDSGVYTALDLAEKGMKIAALVDMRPQLPPLLHQKLKEWGIRVELNARLLDVTGGKSVRAARIATASGDSVKIACDSVAMAGGWSPNVQLTTHLGDKTVWDKTQAAFVAKLSQDGRLASDKLNMAVIGAAKANISLTETLRDAAKQGIESAQALGFKLNHPIQAAMISGGLAMNPSATAEIEKNFLPNGREKGKIFVDYQNDVTSHDIDLAVKEGMVSPEHVKRYTTMGMATDQGKTSAVNGAMLIAAAQGIDVAALGTPAPRPPYTPVALAALAGGQRGKHFKPTRLTPSHAWAVEQNAVLVEAGLWLRGQYFPREGENDWLTTVNREVLTVRHQVGVCDVSTLGKIEVQGRDAAEFLERIYINGWKNLPVGRARYGVMLREDGIVLDDGTAARLGEDQFFVTTTTANAARVMQHMEFCHQVLWPQLDVHMISVTEQWAQYAVAGRHARAVLRPLVDAAYDLADDAFPYMAAAAVTVMGGIEARLYRLSFSGEMAYEIGVPARYGDDFFRQIMAAGAAYGICAYGTEALSVMRIEKGHPAGGELNGICTAGDLGLARMMSSKKDYIGRVMATRPGLMAENRPNLVGLLPLSPGQRLKAGAHLVAQGKTMIAEHDEGYITSVAFSPNLGHWIGLGYVNNGRNRQGEAIAAVDYMRGETYPVEITSPVFFDPDGARLRGNYD
ncbi:MAG: sarcosine oxidase subunit alpha family protein [Candidatus Symbiobacter sp.]|nr:sarcosine oxidase subunit alpha family protein [Candidatus Symbiobacter sp.]